MITRRTCLAAAPAALLALSRPRAAWAGAPTQAVAADAFVDSIGVNTHLSSGLYASRFAEMAERLGASGIRHVRDELRPANDLSRWRALSDRFGIRSQMLVSPATNTVPEMLHYLRALGVERVCAIEGQNEGDSDWFKAQPQARPNWAVATVAYQREVHAALRAVYSAQVLPLVSPSIIDWKPGDVRLIREAAPYCDFVAIHPYVQHGEHPETTDDYAAIGWYLRMMRDGFKPGAPAMATETGYCNIVHPRSSSVSEAASGKYIPRLLLNNFMAGVRRSFLYEFLDEGFSTTDGEQNYGLLRADLSPKPAYLALARLIAALSDRGPDFTPGRLAFASDAVPDHAAWLLFQKRDGSFILAVWLAVPSWNVAQARDIAVPARPVEIAFDAPLARAEAMNIGGADGWTSLAVTRGRVRLDLHDQVTLLRLTLA
jgi:hypothetical protein